MAPYRRGDVFIGTQGYHEDEAAAGLRQALAFHLLEVAAAHILGAAEVTVESDQIDAVVVRFASGDIWSVTALDADEAQIDMAHLMIARPDPRSVTIVLPISPRLADAQATAQEIVERARGRTRRVDQVR